MTNKFQMLNILPFSWVKNISDIVAETRVSSGAAAKPCASLIIVKDKKLEAKNPQALVPSSTSVETINTGRFPHIAAAEAVKNVPLPVVSCSRPTMLKDISSADTL